MKVRSWLLLFILPIFLLMGLRAQATHIVGGEISLQRATGRTEYQLRLTLYFDAINGSPGALDQAVEIRIFQKSDNALVRSEVLQLTGDALVNYTNPECALTPDGVQTRRLVYTTPNTIPVGELPDSGGYYAVWDRCCRNSGIVNIFTPGEVGQLFYLEFPGSELNGQPFINSSPTIFPPLSDFACRGQAFRFSFGGSDIDGDSLAYSMATPLIGNSSATNVGNYPNSVPPEPRPYPEVNWMPGFSLGSEVTGNPPLSVDPQTGVLSMKPDRIGLFVFAIECREYRHGRYLGLVRREYQILVKDCEPNTPPHVAVRTPANFAIGRGDTVVLNFETGAACLPITIADTLPDRVTVTLIAPGLSRFGRFTDTVGNTTAGNPVFSTTYCINSCAAFGGGVLEKVIVRVRDNACSIPAIDTLLFYVKVESKPIPTIEVYPIDTILGMADTLLVVPGTASYIIQVRDSLLNSSINYSVTPPLPAGSSLTVGPARAGPPTLTNYDVTLKLDCSLDTSIRYRVRFIAASSFCGFARRDTLDKYFYLFKLPYFPHIQVTDSLGNFITDGQAFSLRPNQTLPFTLAGQSDFDIDPVRLSYSSTLPIAASFTPKTGPSPQTSPWSWSPTCKDLGNDVQLWVQFEASTVDCGHTRRDSLRIRIDLADTSGGDPHLINIVTPNADHLNDRLTWQRPAPVENCTDKFERLNIYNRWGRAIFSTTHFDFVWPPSGISPGVYFVSYQFAGKKRVQWVEVVK